MTLTDFTRPQDLEFEDLFEQCLQHSQPALEAEMKRRLADFAEYIGLMMVIDEGLDLEPFLPIEGIRPRIIAVAQRYVDARYQELKAAHANGQKVDWMMLLHVRIPAQYFVDGNARLHNLIPNHRQLH